MLHPQRTLNCGGQLLLLDHPKVMGILNLTPDSFYDGGVNRNEKTILSKTETMLAQGASIIDVGGMSSRPGAIKITPKEELQRVLPVLKKLVKTFPNTIFSIDTVHSIVAKACIEVGASMINDISAGRFDEQLYPTVAELGVPYVLMHMQGTPENMQQNPNYKNDIIVSVYDFFIAEIEKLRALGVKDIVLDVGFGFGKTIPHNFQLLRNMHAFQALELPVMAGLSRKSMIYKTLNTTAEAALNGTTALNMIALQQGAEILRVHDVQAAIETITLWEQLEAVEDRS